jgi:hypothetical protein
MIAYGIYDTHDRTIWTSPRGRVTWSNAGKAIAAFEKHTSKRVYGYERGSFDKQRRYQIRQIYLHIGPEVLRK